MIFVQGVQEIIRTLALPQLAYNEGLVIVRCYGCDNHHLIADRLNWFEEGSVDVHDLIAKYGATEEGAPSSALAKSAHTSLQLSADDIAVLSREIKAKAEALKQEEAAKKDGK